MKNYWYAELPTKFNKIVKTLERFLLIIISGSIIGCSSPDKKESDILPSSYTGNYKADFNDLLRDYKAAARNVGIAPIKNRKVAETKKKDLVEIKNGKYYVIDPEMNRSIPFLVPHAKNLLDEIGREFSDSLSTLGYPRYQLIISSVLRTEEDIKNMKKIDHNENVSKDSPHRFGNAFDLKYLSFEKGEGNDKDVNPEGLKNVLASVLLHFKEHAWITYETGQACFHIVSKGTYIFSPEDFSALSSYTVEWGNTLWSIIEGKAKEFWFTGELSWSMKKEIIQKIKVWNPNLDIDHIKAGDTIYWDNEEIKNTIYQRKK